MKWMFWLTIALIWMGGTDFAGCSGCRCTEYQIDYDMARDARISAEAAYETAVGNGADQETLDELNAERMKARQNAFDAEERLCF